ncbi:MAG: 8-hydroxy-5-deazaflavin:NADPH oxidoreductase [Betaproteobacteria bacterium]|jgi:predicted dinucleotide-binding enzyme|nr:8-hydroxy-5-deazaflavin:NADPH oxidoreductase [Betaproteobacteria bacterium]
MKRRAFLSVFLAAAALPAFAQAKPMKIGVIGSGRIGSTLGGLWVKAGHEVMFSDRDPEQVKRAIDGLGPRARAGSVQEAVAFGDAILIAVPYAALPAIRDQVGAQLKGKVVIDPNNPVPSRDGEMGAQAKEKGAGVSSAALLPGTRIVRSFNSWGYATMAREANRPAPRMALPVAADDAGALKTGMQLVADAGFDPVNAGSLAASKAFDLGSSVSGKVMTAEELRKALSLK